MLQNQPPWFRGATIYQIYPRSFFDANNDGIGDLPGIIEKLDYLAGSPDSLGVDAVWLSPFYPSPMADFGYDITDYCDVDPTFGSLDDFKRLVAEAHQRNLRIIVDFVPNHTSDQHPWFIASRQSRRNPRHDWYVWKDPGPNGEPPNNWLSLFGGPAWQFDETRQQFYLHSFLSEQPDLNWDNPSVREAMQHNVRFWFDLGVDGIRVDAVWWLSKDPGFRDDPPNPSGDEDPYNALKHDNSREGPRLFEYLSLLAQTVKEYGEKFMIVEAYPDIPGDVNEYIKFYKNIDPSVCAPFNFEGIFLPWDAATFRDYVDTYQQHMKDDYEPIYCLGNHDRHRLTSRIGRPAAKVAAVMLLTLPGTTFMYYGDELGMTDVPIAPDQVHDPFELNVPGKGLGRDPVRTPLQWSAEAYAGFSNTTPWLPVADDASRYNVREESADKQSFLTLYRHLLSLCDHSPVLKHGSYQSFDAGDGIYAFTRTDDSEKFVILLNFTVREIRLAAPVKFKEVKFSISNRIYSKQFESLPPNEAIVATI